MPCIFYKSLKFIRKPFKHIAFYMESASETLVRISATTRNSEAASAALADVLQRRADRWDGRTDDDSEPPRASATPAAPPTDEARGRDDTKDDTGDTPDGGSQPWLSSSS